MSNNKEIERAELHKTIWRITVSSYVEQEDTREKIDIQQLNVEIEQIAVRQSKLRTQSDAIVADLEGAV